MSAKKDNGARNAPTRPPTRPRVGGTLRTVCVVTGTRAEFGLLRPVMRAVQGHKGLALRVVVAGAHFLPPARTVREVEAEFEVAARVRMQEAGRTGRAADAVALGRGVEGFARAFTRIKPDWVVVLGDRIEALAAASAASVGGWALAHIHGGDRAEGIADEAMRHAITKMAHLHLAATEMSGKRIVRMGEEKARVRVVGSPAVDGLAKIKAMSRRETEDLGDPRVVVLLHPSGFGAAEESRFAESVVMAARCFPHGGDDLRVVLLEPNHDAGREGIMDRWEREARGSGWPLVGHMRRERFVGLLKRLSATGGILVGNSSAGLIEAAAIGLPVVNVGPRQAGRERGPNVIDLDPRQVGRVSGVIRRAAALHGRIGPSGVYGDGHAGERIARVLAEIDPGVEGFLRKRNVY